MEFRKETDSLGEVTVPADAYYGAQTQRAIQNFRISGMHQFDEFIWATAAVKLAAARANMMTGELDAGKGEAIAGAAQEILEGKLREQFVVDVFQAGAGTSHNMNANEVIANRAIELLGGRRGDYTVVHPNDHVNMSQSTNDTVPTAIRISSIRLISELNAELKLLIESLNRKGREFDSVVKSGRTHLEDAAPVRLGQEFRAYADMLDYDMRRLVHAMENLSELNIGATAVGTGVNADPLYVEKVVNELTAITGFRLKNGKSLMALTQSMTDFVEASGAVRTLSSDITKIANDLRLMNSGPVTGLGEITVPPVQPGSSIMPGKVNPVIAECMNMIAFQCMGNDLSLLFASQAGQLELNVMMPLIAFDLLFSLRIMKNGLRMFREKLIDGIAANEKRCREMVERSPGIALVLNPYIGYGRAAEAVKESLKTGKAIRQIVLERGWLDSKTLDSVLDFYAMTEPGIKGKKPSRRSN
ncbi:MAG: aspartate ammonia-lyase [Candidatus Thermoplasmatota archaeon]|nr:aspartate ammonia-lyase [Candidatus Thermoplasmatota archaeon]